MKRTPKTPIEFDYDLWTTEDGKCMVRVKRTGEQCEVSKETFRILRSEEKRLRRFYAGTQNSEDEEQICPILSLDTIPEDDVKEASWLADPNDYAEEVMVAILKENFCLTLTDNQLGVFRHCMIEGKSISAYAREIGLDFSTVKEARDAIRKKFKKFFQGTP